MKSVQALLFFTIICLLSACEDIYIIDTSMNPGKHDILLQVDGEERSYILHIPENYEDSISTPVVFMLHGSDEDANSVYNESGWSELADSVGIMAVFPQSVTYCIKQDSLELSATKWNTLFPDFELCDNSELKDDIRFFREITSDLHNRFNIDSSKYYMTGFGNGGSMSFRCAIEMSDLFTAIYQSSGSVLKDTTLSPKEKIPIAMQIGSLESGIAMDSLAWAIQNRPAIQKIVQTHASSFQLQDIFSISGMESSIMMAEFDALDSNMERPFRLSLVNGLGFLYPNGENHWLNSANQQWEWFKQYVKE